MPIAVENYNSELNPEKALTLALVHDDAEIITDDVSRYDKDRMTQEQLLYHEQREEDAIKYLSTIWPKNINGFSYKGLLYHALRKDCLEAQLVSYCDKIDGFCEALHEFYTGNKKFKGTSLDYIKKLREFPEKFQQLARILPSNHSLLSFPPDINVREIIKNKHFHFPNSVKKSTEVPHYNRWKELTIEFLGLSHLVDIIEN